MGRAGKGLGRSASREREIERSVEELNRVIEKSKQVDIEIEEKKEREGKNGRDASGI